MSTSIPNSENLSISLHRAQALLEQRGDIYLTGEHLLYGLLSNPTVEPLLRACKIDVNSLSKTLLEEMERILKSAARLSRPSRQPMVTETVSNSLYRGFQYAHGMGSAQIDGVHVLLGLLGQEESTAVFLLTEAGLDEFKAKSLLAHGRLPDETMPATGVDAPEGSAPSALEQFAVNLNQRARDGKIDPLIGREHEVERTVQILCRRRKNNPLLVGDPGVGKTAIAEGLAKRIVEKTVPAVLSAAEIYSVDLGAMLAGTKYRGDFENRIKDLLKQAQSNPNVILFIDEIHTMIGAGSASGGAMDASNLLKPALAAGSLRLIGSTTFKEYREVFEKDQALVRRFQKIDVNEPTPNQTVAILEGLRSRFEKHHGVTYTPEALTAAVDLSVRYMTDRLLPDKAIDLIDEAGARQRVVPESARRSTLDRSDIEATIARMTQIPAEQVSNTDRSILATLDSGLRSSIYGQDEAIASLVNAIKLSRAGLRDENKPIGCFLLAGPTGVGKTEVTRQLARQMGITLKRFDMSEYVESHAVARLIGAPPGYVGFDKGGLLTEAVKQTPYCVLLLDEIEKAHPDIYNILLQVMDRGVLTDSNGRSVDFKNVILIMTTNAGARHASRASIGFTQQDHTTDAMEVIKMTFSPEFRNRLDRVVQFKALGPDEVLSVVRKNLLELSLKLMSRNVRLTVSLEAENWLATHGFDPQMGARPLARLIEEKVKQPLADLMLFGDLANGGNVQVVMGEKEPDIHVETPVEDCHEAAEV